MDQIHETEYYCNKGHHYLEEGLFKRALINFREALNTVGENPREVLPLLLNMVQVYYLLGNYEMCENTLVKAMSMSERICRNNPSIDDKRTLSVIYNFLSAIYEVTWRDQLAIQLYTQDFQIAKDIVDRRGNREDLYDLAVSYNNLAGVCINAFLMVRHQVSKEPLAYYEKSIKILKQLDDTDERIKHALAVNYEKIGAVYEMLKEDADVYYKQALSCRLACNKQDLVSINHLLKVLHQEPVEGVDEWQIERMMGEKRAGGLYKL